MLLILLSTTMWVGLGVGCTVLAYEHITLSVEIVIGIAIFVVVSIIVNFVAISRYSKTRINR